MTKFLGIFILILSLLLFPPATLALISNNAIPGDATYPIKRGLESGIVSLASINPITKAWFSVNRTGRRFNEVTALIAKGESATDSLDELVTQTTQAAEEIKKIDDPVKKQQYIENLTNSIDKYNDKLSQIEQKQPDLVAQSTPTPVASENPTPLPTLNTITQTPQPNSLRTTPTSTPTPSPTPFSSPSTRAPRATVAPTPSPTVMPTIAPRPSPSLSPVAGAEHGVGNDIKDARQELEDIKQDLIKDVKKIEKENSGQSKEKKNDNKDNKEHKAKD